jgi:hypothetical protein
VDRVARRFFKPFVTSQADFRAASPPEWQVAWADPLSGQQIVLENPPNNVSVVIGLLALSRLIRPSLWSVNPEERLHPHNLRSQIQGKVRQPRRWPRLRVAHRANVAALDDVATAVLVRSFTEMAFPLVPSRSSRERVKSLRREVLRKFGSNKHASFMLRMRLSLDCGCVTVATQGGHDNRFTVITRTVALSLSMIFLHR